MSEIAISNVNSDFSQKELPGPWPLYALFLIGFGLNSFFAWSMVCWALWAREKKAAFSLGLAANAGIFFTVWLVSVYSETVWWKLLLTFTIADQLWVVAACAYQYKMIGPAPKRFLAGGLPSKIAPLVTGAVMGLCIAVLFSIPGAIESRREMLMLWDSLNRETVLWDLFRNAVVGTGVGLAVGFWWAGNPKGFKIRDVVTYLAAFFFSTVFLAVMMYFLYFLEAGGTPSNLFGASDWGLFPTWIDGLPKQTIRLGFLSGSAGILILPLLFGSPERFRAFALRLLILPLAFACSFPFLLVDNDWWRFLQSEIIYNMSAPEDDKRDDAHEQLSILHNQKCHY